MFGLDVTFDGNITDIKNQLREQIAAMFEVTQLSLNNVQQEIKFNEFFILQITHIMKHFRP